MLWLLNDSTLKVGYSMMWMPIKSNITRQAEMAIFGVVNKAMGPKTQ